MAHTVLGRKGVLRWETNADQSVKAAASRVEARRAAADRVAVDVLLVSSLKYRWLGFYPSQHPK